MNSDRVMSRRFFLETLVGVAVVAALPGCLTSSRRDTSAKRATGRRHDPAKDGAPPVDGYFIGRFSEDVLNLIKHGDIDVEGNFFARSDALDTSLRNKSLDQQTDTFTFLQQSYRDVAMEYLLITANHNRHNRIEMGSTLEGLADLYIAEALSVSRKDTHHLRELIASDQKNFGYEREKHLSDFLTILEQRLVSLNLYDNLVNPLGGEKIGKRGQINFKGVPFMPIEAIRKLTPLEEFTTVFQGYNRDVPSRKSIDAFDTKVSTFYEQLSKRVSEHSGTFQYEVNEKGAIVTDYSLNTDSLFRHVDFYLASIKQANHLARRPKEGIELNRLLRLIEHGEGVYSDKEHNQTRKLASWHGERLRRGLAWDEMNVADTQYTDNLNDVELAGQNASYFAGHFLAGRVYDAKIAHHKRKQHQEDHLGEVSREDMQAGYERLLLDYGPDIAEHYGGLAFAAGMGAGKLAGMVMGGLAIHNALTSSASVSSGIPTPPPKVAFPLPSPRF